MHESEPDVYGQDWLTGATVVPLHDSLVGNVKAALWLLLGAVAVVVGLFYVALKMFGGD